MSPLDIVDLSNLSRWIIITKYNTFRYINCLTLKEAGGLKVPAGQEIACNFSQDHTVVTKILDFINKHLNYKVLKSFFDYPDRFFKNLAETDEKLQFFWSKNREIDFFSIFS